MDPVSQNQPIPNPTPPLPQPTKQSVNPFMIIGLILLTAILAGGGVYFFLTSKNKNANPPQAEIKTTPSPQAFNPQITISPIVSTTPSGTLESKFISLDENWNKYSDPVSRFSINVPKQLLEPYANCPYVSTNDHSYRPKEGLVPVQFFVDKGVVFLAAQYTYRLSGETMENGKNFFSKCEKTPNSVAILADKDNYHSPAWDIVIKTINNDTELDQFLKNRYGEGCKLGEKKPFKQEGVFDIQIEGDGLDLGETKCPINYITQVLYYPAQKKLAAWDIGQACSFAYPDFENCKDMEMVDSFRFE